MEQIKKVKSMSIWIFIVPFVAVNTCLILITQFHGLFPDRADFYKNMVEYEQEYESDRARTPDDFIRKLREDGL